MKSALLISTYNWEKALNLVLKSVCKQSLLPNEVIIADDGSREATKLLIDEFRDKLPIPIKHIWHEDKGFRRSKILNKAIANSEADYIIQVDGDCILHKDFIKDHLKNIIDHAYLYGSRVNIRKDYVESIFEKELINYNLFSKEINKRLRTLRIPIISQFYSPNNEISKKLRGCNLSFWKGDFVAINGYNEDLEGWGMEDSEMVIRLHNNGIKGKRLKFSGILYHLYHKVAPKDRVKQNQEIQNTAKNMNLLRCDNGINKYL